MKTRKIIEAIALSCVILSLASCDLLFGSKEVSADEPTTQTPAISVKADPSSGNNWITLSCEDTEAALFYSVHSDKDQSIMVNLQQYTKPFLLLNGTVTIKAVAEAKEKKRSDEASSTVTTKTVTPVKVPTEINAKTITSLGSSAVGTTVFDPLTGNSAELTLEGKTVLDTNTSVFWAQYAEGDAVILQKPDGSIYYQYQKKPTEPSSQSMQPGRGVLGTTVKIAWNITTTAINAWLNKSSRSEFELSYQTTSRKTTETYAGRLSDINDYILNRAKQSSFLISFLKNYTLQGKAITFLSDLALGNTSMIMKLRSNLPEGLSASDLTDDTPVRLTINKITPDSFSYSSTNQINPVLNGLERISYFFDKIFVPGTADVSSYEIKLLTEPSITSLGTVAGLSGPDTEGKYSYNAAGLTGDLVLTPVTSDPAYKVSWGSLYYSSGSNIKIGTSEMRGLGSIILHIVPSLNNMVFSAFEKSITIKLINQPAGSNQLLEPVFWPAPGMYTSEQSVMIYGYDSVSKIWYTQDGNNPVAGTSNQFTGVPIKVSAGTIFKAKQSRTDWSDSSIKQAVYRIFRIKSAPVAATAGETVTVLVADATPNTTATLVVKNGTTEKTRLNAVSDTNGLVTFSLQTDKSWTLGAYTLSAIDGTEKLETKTATLNLSAAPLPVVPTTVAAPVFSVQGERFPQTLPSPCPVRLRARQSRTLRTELRQARQSGQPIVVRFQSPQRR